MHPVMRYCRTMRGVWLCLVVLLGCTSPNENKACSEGSCKDPAFPYCDVDGSVSGEKGTCIAVTCTPGEILTCLGDDALTCNATGSYQRTDTAYSRAFLNRFLNP